MLNEFLPGAQENKVLDGLNNYTQSNNARLAKMTGELNAQQANAERAARIGRIFRLAPHLEPGVIVALANSNADDAQVARAGQAGLYLEQQKADDLMTPKSDGSSLWSKIYGTVKSVLKYATAFEQFRYDMVNNISSSVLQPAPNTSQAQFASFDPQNPFRKGWFASTQLGTAVGALTNRDIDTGNGFFIGGTAEAQRQQRLLDYAGAIPLTIEAGAGEDTGFEADPTQIHELALQILQTENLSYEEAYDKANKQIRSQAFAPMTVSTVFPLAIGGASSLGVPVHFKFSDIGTTQYNLTSMVANLGLQASLGSPTTDAWKGVAKPLIAYSKGRKYVDEAGNFLVDSRNIAQNGAEARMLANIDFLNVAANDYEIAGLAASDAAVEALTPSEGTWWHGSRGGIVPGHDFFDINDPRIVQTANEGNLFGPGLYTSDSPPLGQTYAQLNTGAFTNLTSEELATLEGLTEIPARLEKAIPTADIPFGEQPGTLYRFSEKPGITPNLVDPTTPFTSQVSPEIVDNLLSKWVDVNNASPALMSLFPENDGIRVILDNLGEFARNQFFEEGGAMLGKSTNVSGVADFAQHLKDRLKNELFTDGLAKFRTTTNDIDKQFQWNVQRYITTGINDGSIDNLNFSVTAPQIRIRLAEHLGEFVLSNKRPPSSVDELISFVGNESWDAIHSGPVSIAAGDDMVSTTSRFGLNINESNLDEIIKEVDARISELVAEREIAGQSWIPDEYNALVQWKNSLYTEVNNYDNYLNPLLRYDFQTFIGNHFKKITFRPSAKIAPNTLSGVYMDSIWQQSLEKIAETFNPIVEQRIFNLDMADDVKQTLAAYVDTKPVEFTDGIDFQYWIPGVPKQQVPFNWLTINQTLLENGIDGYMHQGGKLAGMGDFLHNVKIWFDPKKHLDFSDVLTGERLPVNEALDLAHQSGQLAERAGELRMQLDTLRAEQEAGIIHGFGGKIDPAKFNSYFSSSREGKYAVDKMWEVAQDYVPSDTATHAGAWYKMWKMFNGKLSLEVTHDLLNANTREELLSVLNKHAGFTPGLSNIEDLNFSLSKTFDKLKRVSRIDNVMDKVDEVMGPVLHTSPRSTQLHIFGSERQQLEALQNLDSFLETAVRGAVNKVGETAIRPREQILAEFAEAMRTNDRTRLFQASKSIGEAIKARVFAETGDIKQAEIASDIWGRAFDEASGQGLYNVGSDGMRTDNNYAVQLAANGNTQLTNMQHGGVSLLSELQQSPLELPDVQALRRMTSFIGTFTGKQGFQAAIKSSELGRNIAKQFGIDLSKKDLTKLGELRMPLRFTDFMMTKVWKSAKKLSIGYGIRNTMEAQARLAFADRDSIFTHPLDHILVVTHQRIPDDIALGEAFNPEGWRNIGLAHTDAAEAYQTFLGSAYYGADQRIDMVKSQFRNGGFEVYSKDKPTKWAEAGGYELRQLYNDPIARKLAGGASVDDVMTWLYSNDPAAKKALQQLEDLMRKGELFYSSPTQPNVIPVEPTRPNIKARIESQQAGRLATKTGGHSALNEVVATGTINGELAFNPNGTPTEALTNYLVRNIDNDALPSFYKGRGTSSVLLGAQKGWFDHATKWFFDSLMGRTHNILDRSPVWRQEYTKEINRLAPMLSQEAAQQLKQIIIDRTAYYAEIAQKSKAPRTFTMKDYVGRNVDVDELMQSLDNANGWMTRDEMHTLANAFTLDRLEGLLFDATARNSITDAARIVSPFSAAFTEVWRSWIELLATNPDKIVKFNGRFEQLAGTNQSPVLRNNGVTYKDPVTGDYMYSLPMSGLVARLFTGIVTGKDSGAQYSLEAPVKGLNMALNFSPGFSPLVGFPLGKLLYSSPKLRDWATFMLPYGQPKSPTDPSEYIPGWLNKIASGFLSSPRSATVYADVLSDVIRAEVATGKWNLSDPEERTQFYRESENKARVLTIMRGIGQGVGPAAPQVTAKIRTKAGSVFAGFLTAEFHKLQSENYDTAVERFLSIYGEETFAYMAGKTREVMSGVESSKEFAKWETANAELFDTPWAEVAGFFGPKGSEFDWSAWQYQINTGKRERIPAVPTQVEIAEQIIGLHKYRYFVTVAGPKPNQAQRDFLANEKAKLEQEYPGMVTQSSFDVQKFPNRIKMLQEAVDDSRLKNNETAAQLKQYLDLRSTYMSVAASAGVGWQSDRAAPLRADLRFQGAKMAQDVPEFARVFERVLLYEVDK